MKKIILNDCQFMVHSCTYEVPDCHVAPLEPLQHVAHVLVFWRRAVNLCQQVDTDISVVQQHQDVEQRCQHCGVVPSIESAPLIANVCFCLRVRPSPEHARRGSSLQDFDSIERKAAAFSGSPLYTCICFNPISVLNPIFEVLFRNNDQMSWRKYFMHLLCGWKITLRKYSQ